MTIDDQPKPFTLFAGYVLWLLMLSATLFETDAYRFSAIITWAYGTYVFTTLKPKAKLPPMAWYCLGWSFYVLARFAYGYLTSPIHQHGSSEWLYAFPLFFAGIGLSLVRIRQHIAAILLIFFSVALVLLAVSQHWFVIASGLPVIPLYHNNQIHGAVACGMILIGAFYWLLHHARAGFAKSLHGRAALFIAPPVIVLCLISILGSQSKGVWVALAGAVPVGVVMILIMERSRAVRLSVAGLIAAFALWAVVFRDRLWARAGDTVMASLDLIRSLYTDPHGAVLVLQQKIDGGTIPASLNDRLKIWYNAGELVQQSPLFGHGNFWIELWEKTRYADVGYLLMHNGYMEILIRHGFVGLIALFLMLVGFIYLVWRGYRRGIVPAAGFQAYVTILLFFALTLLSNSNNRLAIGESLAMLSGGFAFYAEWMARLGLAGNPERKVA